MGYVPSHYKFSEILIKLNEILIKNFRSHHSKKNRFAYINQFLRKLKPSPMCVINQCQYFYSSDYSVAMNLNESGGISGLLTISLSDNFIKFPLRGLYLDINDLVKFSFSVEWSFPEKEDWGVTCFSGHFIRNRSLTMNWMLLENARENTSGITGSDYLYPSSFMLSKSDELNFRPFPIDIELLLKSETSVK